MDETRPISFDNLLSELSHIHRQLTLQSKAELKTLREENKSLKLRNGVSCRFSQLSGNAANGRNSTLTWHGLNVCLDNEGDLIQARIGSAPSPRTIRIGSPNARSPRALSPRAMPLRSRSRSGSPMASSVSPKQRSKDTGSRRSTWSYGSNGEVNGHDLVDKPFVGEANGHPPVDIGCNDAILSEHYLSGQDIYVRVPEESGIDDEQGIEHNIRQSHQSADTEFLMKTSVPSCVVGEVAAHIPIQFLPDGEESFEWAPMNSQASSMAHSMSFQQGASADTAAASHHVSFGGEFDFIDSEGQLRNLPRDVVRTRSSHTAGSKDCSHQLQQFKLREIWNNAVSQVPFRMEPSVTRNSEHSRASTRTSQSRPSEKRRSHGSGLIANGYMYSPSDRVRWARRIYTLWQSIVVSPDSPSRTMWALASFLFFLYDFVMIPIDVCFGLKGAVFKRVLFWLTCCFWTSDIVFNFVTGVYIDDVLVMNPIFIAQKYCRSWMSIDLSLVALDWTMLALDQVDDKNWIQSFRYLRLLRLSRLLGMVRFLKMETVPFYLDRVMQFSSLVVTSCVIVMGSHVLACVWYLVGDLLDNGWVHHNGIASKSLAERYTTSMQITLGRLQGMRPDIELSTGLENALDTGLIFMSLLVVALYLALVAQHVSVIANTDAREVRRIAHRYIRSHKISRVLGLRAFKFLIAHPQEKVMADEARLLTALPLVLQEDLHYEARHRLVCVPPCFKDLNMVSPRVVRRICHAAITELLVVHQEFVFAVGDACEQMFFVTSGELWYFADEFILENTPRSLARIPGKESGIDILRKGCNCCEASLWTYWENCGDLEVYQDTILLVLGAAQFSTVITQHWAACAHLVKYGRHFLWHLNRCVHSDVMGFRLQLDKLDDQLFSGTAEDHAIFISHYKEESGTEATLMRDQFESLLRTDDPLHSANDLPSPIFIDSENLEDLARLQMHVRGSEALVLLLTPGLLTRPWCLLEIVTAIQHDVQIVPVEVQRPGMQYRYPDDAFYSALRNGGVVDAQGTQMLEKQGVSLQETEAAIRKVFNRIALPFSPHKSGNVRRAELRDIMSRCIGFERKARPSTITARTQNTRVSRYNSSEASQGAGDRQSEVSGQSVMPEA